MVFSSFISSSFLPPTSSLSSSSSLSLTSLLILFHMVASIQSSRRELIRDIICTSETLALTCQVDRQVIIVRRALYGRMEPGKCITSEYAHAMGCYADVTTHVQDLCSGQSHCSLMVASIDAIAQPCGKDFKSYLDIEHECVRASYTNDCTANNSHSIINMTTATSNSNLDSNVPTINNGFLVLHPYFQYFHPSDPYVIHDDASTKSCPWILETDPGRKFNVTWRVPSSTLLLMDGSDLVPLNDDLGIGNHQHPNYSPIQPQHQQHLPPPSSSSSATYCGYAWKFVDGEEEMFYAACVSGIKKPQTRFFLSKTNRLEVHYTGSSQKREHARLPLLEFKVVGCRHYRPPDGTFTSGHEDNMNVVCNTSGQVWHVTCQDGIWKGTVGSCNGGNQARENAAVHIKPSAMPRLEMKLDRAGVITAVLVGILLGGTFGAMLLLGIFILKRRESSNRNRLQHKSSSNKANNNKTTTTNFNETIYNTPPMNQHHVHPDYQLPRQQQLQMHPHKPQQPQYRQMSNNSLNRNTDREHLQQLHISADVISACHRCYDDHPPPSYSLDQQTTCTCLANQQSPTCCYSDQTKLISFTGASPEISCCHRNSKNDLTAERSLVLTNMADRTPGHVIDDDIMESGKNTTLSRGSLRKFSKNEYLAVKSDEVDD